MWLYAAGLLLMDAVLKLNDEASPITVSSMYGLILNVVKVRVHQTPNSSCPDRKSVWETLVKVLRVTYSMDGFGISETFKLFNADCWTASVQVASSIMTCKTME